MRRFQWNGMDLILIENFFITHNNWRIEYINELGKQHAKHIKKNERIFVK